jgi:hypothetical protein
LGLDPRDSGASIPRRGLAEDASPSAGPVAGSAHGRT